MTKASSFSLSVMVAGFKVLSFVALGGLLVGPVSLNFGASSFPISFEFYFDGASLVFCSIICWISSAIFTYSGGYMSEELFKARFHGVLFLFVISMVILSLSGNMYTFILGWDGLGVTSFLLVIFYNSNSALSGGLITMCVNRLGDGFMILALMYVLSRSGSLLALESYGYTFMCTFYLTLAALTKSAQVPFSSWLPAAMAAPTPASALVHSSTLVTAGVYLVVRYGDIMEDSPAVIMLLFLGIFTASLAGVSALTEVDLKKVVALSTLSQLGFMMTGLGLGMGGFVLFHMWGHAFFKALLFMGVGSILHMKSGYQDLRSGGAPFSGSAYVVVIVSSFSMMGLPLLTGYYSKDLMLELSTHIWIIPSESLIWFGLVALTSLYSARMVVLLYKSAPLTSLWLAGGPSCLEMRGMDHLVVLAIAGGFGLSLWGFPHKIMLTLPASTKWGVMILSFSGLVLILSQKLLLSGMGSVWGFTGLKVLTTASFSRWPWGLAKSVDYGVSSLGMFLLEKSWGSAAWGGIFPKTISFWAVSAGVLVLLLFV